MNQSNYPRGRALVTGPPELETNPFILPLEDVAIAASRRITPKIWIIWFVAAIYIGGAIEFAEHGSSGRPLDLFPVWLLLALVLVMLVLQKRSIRKTYERWMKEPEEALFFNASRTVRFSSTGIFSTIESCALGEYSWNLVKRISFDNKSVTVLLGGGGQVLIVPNAAFKIAQYLNDLKSFAIENGFAKQ